MRERERRPSVAEALEGHVTLNGEAFRAAVRRFAEEQRVPLIPFRSRQDKLATVRPQLDAAAAAEREGVVAIGVAQERRSVWMGSARHPEKRALQHCDFYRAERRITVYYFYLFDAEWGPCSIQICTYAPY